MAKQSTDKAAVKRAASNAKRSVHIQTRKKVTDPKPTKINMKHIKLSDGQEKFIWEKADPVSAANQSIYRKDVAGAMMKITEFGLESELGWVYALIDPEGEADDVNNVVALHWMNAKVKRKAGEPWVAKVTGKKELNNLRNFIKETKIPANALEKTRKTVLFQPSIVEAKKINVEIPKFTDKK